MTVPAPSNPRHPLDFVPVCAIMPPILRNDHLGCRVRVGGGGETVHKAVEGPGERRLLFTGQGSEGL